MPPDPRDVRVLIPRVRRAVEGPGSVTLTDEEIKDITADAIGEVILYTGGVFGKTLEVTARDDQYGAPIEYQTSEELTLAEQAVIAAQAAINHFFFMFAGVKVQESIGDEAQTWSYGLSANLLTEQLRQLVRDRDAALEQVKDEGVEISDSYTSFIAVRDVHTSQLIEPWVGALGAGAGIEVDHRFA